MYHLSRKFSTLFQTFGLTESIAFTTISLGILKTIRKTVKGGTEIVIDILYDLFILVDVYLISNLVMKATTGRDTLILLVSVMAVARVAIVLFL